MSTRRSSHSDGPNSIPAEITISDDLTVATFASATSEDSVGLPVPLKKQLLKDIEHPSFGGIKRLQSKPKGAGSHFLPNLLDAKEEERLAAGKEPLYHPRGHETRTRISDLVQRWKKFPRAKYLELLGSFQVTACEFHPEYDKATVERLYGSPPPGKTKKERRERLKAASGKKPEPKATKTRESTRKTLFEDTDFTKYRDTSAYSSDNEEPLIMPITDELVGLGLPRDTGKSAVLAV